MTTEERNQIVRLLEEAINKVDEAQGLNGMSDASTLMSEDFYDIQDTIGELLERVGEAEAE